MREDQEQDGDPEGRAIPERVGEGRDEGAEHQEQRECQHGVIPQG